MLDSSIRVAYTASFDFDEDVAWLKFWHRYLLEGDRRSLRFEDADLVFFWKTPHGGGVVCCYC